MPWWTACQVFKPLFPCGSFIIGDPTQLCPWLDVERSHARWFTKKTDEWIMNPFNGFRFLPFLKMPFVFTSRGKSYWFNPEFLNSDLHLPVGQASQYAWDGDFLGYRTFSDKTWKIPCKLKLLSVYSLSNYALKSLVWNNESSSQ